MCPSAPQEDLKARRRMLGNIQFIGELFKEKMLTEKIMHECIVKLLGNVRLPSSCRPEPHWRREYTQTARGLHRCNLVRRLQMMTCAHVTLSSSNWHCYEGPESTHELAVLW